MIVVLSLLLTRTLFFSIKAFGNNILKYIIQREEILNGLSDIFGLCAAICYIMRGFDDIIVGYKRITELNRWFRWIEVRDSIGLLSGGTTTISNNNNNNNNSNNNNNNDNNNNNNDDDKDRIDSNNSNNDNTLVNPKYGGHYIVKKRLSQLNKRAWCRFMQGIGEIILAHGLLFFSHGLDPFHDRLENSFNSLIANIAFTAYLLITSILLWTILSSDLQMIGHKKSGMDSISNFILSKEVRSGTKVSWTDMYKQSFTLTSVSNTSTSVNGSASVSGSPTRNNNSNNNNHNTPVDDDMDFMNIHGTEPDFQYYWQLSSILNVKLNRPLGIPTIPLQKPTDALCNTILRIAERDAIQVEKAIIERKPHLENSMWRHSYRVLLQDCMELMNTNGLIWALHVMALVGSLPQLFHKWMSFTNSATPLVVVGTESTDNSAGYVVEEVGGKSWYMAQSTGLTVAFGSLAIEGMVLLFGMSIAIFRRYVRYRRRSRAVPFSGDVIKAEHDPSFLDNQQKEVVDAIDTCLQMAPYYSASEMEEFLLHGEKKYKLL